MLSAKRSLESEVCGLWDTNIRGFVVSPDPRVLSHASVPEHGPRKREQRTSEGFNLSFFSSAGEPAEVRNTF